MERRAGEKIQLHALVLDSYKFGDLDKIVSVLTQEYGKISLFAPAAAKSLKRFGACFEPMNHIVVSVKVPREANTAEGSQLWRVEQAEFKNGFPGWRDRFENLETGLFVVRLVKDILPDGALDPSCFRALGRFLRAGESMDFQKFRGWGRFIFWSWFCSHLGNSPLLIPREISDALPPHLINSFEAFFATKEPSFESLFSILNAGDLLPFSRLHEQDLYLQWLEQTGLHWAYFEKWQKNFL